MADGLDDGTAAEDGDGLAVATGDGGLDGAGDAEPTATSALRDGVPAQATMSAAETTARTLRPSVRDGCIRISWAGAVRQRDDDWPMDERRSTRATGPYDRAMLLALDVGNTNITIGLFRNGALAATRRAATARRASADELEHLLGALLALDDASFADVSAVVCASVVPSVTDALETVAARRERPLLVATAGTVPIAIRTDRPADVGPDRLVNALAVARIHGTPAIVVDLGTATTFDCVAGDGAFVGGAIAPGLELGLDALAAGTARLPRVDLRAPDRAIGRDTVGAIQSGAILGYQALVEGLLGRIRRELAESSAVAPGDVRVILTGGLSATAWARAIEAVDAIDPDLTLKGLAILHAEVSGGQPLELGLPG